MTEPYAPDWMLREGEAHLRETRRHRRLGRLRIAFVALGIIGGAAALATLVQHNRAQAQEETRA